MSLINHTPKAVYSDGQEVKVGDTLRFKGTEFNVITPYHDFDECGVISLVTALDRSVEFYLEDDNVTFLRREDKST